MGAHKARAQMSKRKPKSGRNRTPPVGSGRESHSYSQRSATAAASCGSSVSIRCLLPSPSTRKGGCPSGPDSIWTVRSAPAQKHRSYCMQCASWELACSVVNSHQPGRRCRSSLRIPGVQPHSARVDAAYAVLRRALLLGGLISAWTAAVTGPDYSRLSEAFVGLETRATGGLRRQRAFTR
jgi:hypothetical protein